MKNYSEDDTRVKFIDTKLYESSYKEENIRRNYYLQMIENF